MQIQIFNNKLYVFGPIKNIDEILEHLGEFYWILDDEIHFVQSTEDSVGILKDPEE